MYVDDDHTVQKILNLHANKLSSETDAQDGAYILDADESGCVSIDAYFVHYEKEELISHFDTDKRSVQWLMRQVVTTEGNPKAFVAGVKFKSGEVLCHVFPKRVGRESASKPRIR